MKPKYYKQKWKTLTYGSNIKTLVNTRRAWEVKLVSLPGQGLAAQTLSIKGREERVKEMGSDVIICAFTRGPRWGELAASPGLCFVSLIRWGPSIKYVTLFFDDFWPPPSPCHKLSQILDPPPLKVCHTSEQKVNKQISRRMETALNCLTVIDILYFKQ